jgi:hypothetical protein
MKRRLLPALVACAAVAPPLLAQDDEDAPTAQPVAYAAPESPAFTFLSASPAKVSRPNSLRDFVFSLISGVNADGNAQQGFAFEVAPWYFIPGVAISLDAYQNNWPSFVFANTQVSLGTVRVSGDDADTDASFGLRIGLFDQGDPMRNLEFTSALGQAMLDECAPDMPGEDTDPACPGLVVADLLDEWNDEHWNARRVTLAFATGTRLRASDFNEREALGFRTWLVGTNPIGGDGQFLGQIEYSHRPTIEGAASLSKVAYGFRILIGSSVFNAFGELMGETSFDTSDDSDETSGLWSVGAEFKVFEGLWVSTGIGSRFASLAEPERAVVVANLRWGMTSGARLTSLRQPRN